LNAFIIIISIGYSTYFYVNADKENAKLLDRNYSPIQLVSQIRGYFYINPALALSLVITLFSFAGIPPLIGFFAKQVVLSAALDEGYYFIAIIAILTSVISAVYYLNIIKEMIFKNNENEINREISEDLQGHIQYKNNVKKYLFKFDNIQLSSSLTVTISSLTLIILLFIFFPENILNMANILSIMLFNS